MDWSVHKTETLFNVIPTLLNCNIQQMVSAAHAYRIAELNMRLERLMVEYEAIVFLIVPNGLTL